ncbi:hypothetical protein HUS23_12475 [Ectothiorhodospiraceae bacterium 2226]|nr:hypothetical protein HUS23_12475 [Ectothiorhodospiraceae bacterium 2226]
MTENERLAERFEELDARISGLEAQLTESTELSIDQTLPEASAIARDLLRAYAEHGGKDMPDTDDLLETQKAFVKGDPSLNAVRDNVRELVYYRNCIDMDRRDALPKAAERMAVRTARHIYLYLRTRAAQEGRLD